MKRGVLGFPLLVFLAQFVSAQFLGGYGSFSITSFFSSIDSETIILGSLFFIFFIILFAALIRTRFLKNNYGEPNRVFAGFLAGLISLLIIYGIYRSGFNLGDLFYGFGISEDVLYFIALIIFIILAAFLIKKIKFRGFLIVFGLLLSLLAIFTNFFYEKGFALVIGIVLLLIGLWLLRRWKRKGRGKNKLTGNYNNYGPSPQSNRGNSLERAKELEARHKIDYYNQLEKQREAQAIQQRRGQERNERQRRAQEEKIKKRYVSRFGKRAWKKREKKGINF
ncbi:MAG TPA: hypothetical protein VMV95_01835 [Bacillota bacterium]|nr:hypothetical protein [Bacillota bacterium]